MHHVDGVQFVLELAHRGRAAPVVGIETVEHLGGLRAAGADARKQQLGFLRVVDPLRKLVDVEQHRAQHREVGQVAAPTVLGQQQADRAQHRRQRAMLVVDDLEGGVR